MSVNIVLPFEPVKGASGNLVFSPEQIDRMRNIAIGRDSSFSRRQALEILQAVNFPNKIRDLQKLLEDERESSEMRHLAASGLYRANTPEALNILVNNSHVQDERILLGVIKGLGRIGNEGTLKTLSKVRSRVSGVVAFQAEFAAALISYRFGLAGNDLRVPNNSEFLQLTAGENRPFQVDKPSEDEAQICLTSIASQPFGIQYSENNLRQIRCGKNNWMLVLNKDFSEQNAVQLLQLRKAFVGIIADKNEESGLYSTALLLFTSLSGHPNTLNIQVHRATGEQIFAGIAQVEDSSKATLSVHSISRPGGFPVNIEGTFEGANLNFQTTLSGTQVRERRHPTKVNQT